MSTLASTLASACIARATFSHALRAAASHAPRAVAGVAARAATSDAPRAVAGVAARAAVDHATPPQLSAGAVSEHVIA